MRCSSSVVNPVVVAPLLEAVYIAANNECVMKRQIIFRYINSAVPQLYCLKFSFKWVDISESYAK